MKLTIAEIASACRGQLFCAPAAVNTQVTGVVLDSRKVTEGGVFVATVGERVDGHKFIGDVYAKGASLVICEKTPECVEAEQGVTKADWKNYLLVADCFQALKEIAEYYRSKLTIPVVGITGSVGKTSTKEFIAGVLSEQYRVLKTEGNYNNEIGVPLTLLQITEEHEAAVIEMGISDFGEMHCLSKMVRPTICVITNIGQCHLENLKSRDGILKAKTEIFDFMQPEGEVCLNGEDDKLATIDRVNGKAPHFFGLGGNSAEEVYAHDVVSRGLLGSEALMYCKAADGAADFAVKVPLPGVHMVTNAAAATCVAKLLGLDMVQIAKGIAGVTPVGGRTNLIALGDCTLIDDCYNANPISMKAAIDLLMMANNRKIAILGDMFELGEDSDALHEEVGRYAAESGVEVLLCAGANSVHMANGAKNTLREAVTYFENREKLLDFLACEEGKALLKNSTVLIKASHGMGYSEVVKYLSLFLK